MNDVSVELETLGAASTVLVAQITDIHLGAEPGSALAGMDTDASFSRVLELVRMAPRQPDLLLVTGDLASNGAVQAYARVRDAFDALGVPWFCLPGNHDSVGVMHAVIDGAASRTRSVRTRSWQIVLLDSTIPGVVGGTLGADELALLERLLREDQSRHAMICLHHHPVPVGCTWLDEQRLTDADALFALLARHAQVRAVVWGHVHQEFAAERNGLQLFSAPSTCIQFASGSDCFRLDELAPGLRWFELHPDGRIVTRVERLVDAAPGFDRDSRGYL